MGDMLSSFPEQPSELDQAHTTAALDWLAGLHASRWGLGADGIELFAHGSYYGLDKAGRKGQLTKMRSHWDKSVQNIPELAEQVFDAFPERLQDAAEAIFAQLYNTKVPPGKQQASGRKRKRGGGPSLKRLEALLEGDPPIQTVITGDFKCENLFFRPAAEGQDRPACGAVDFQWAGGGPGCVDVVYLFWTSLEVTTAPRFSAPC